jgi:hypothetical protein
VKVFFAVFCLVAYSRRGQRRIYIRIEATPAPQA